LTKIIITGGCGFIGAKVSDLLLKSGLNNIRIIDNFSVCSARDLGAQINLPLKSVFNIDELDWAYGIQILKGDVRDKDLMMKASEGCDAIIHLAANTGVAPSVLDPLYDCLTNVVGTLNMLECCRQNSIKKFVFASSGAPLGEQLPPLNEISLPKPASPYGASKLAGEGYCSAYNVSFGIDTIALRFGNVYGPGSMHKGSAVAKFIKVALAEEPIEVYGDGSQTRDFIYIDDLTKAIQLALEIDNVGGEIFQIATASETSVNELIAAMKEVFLEQNLKFPKVKFSEQRVGDVKRNYSDTSKAQAILGWQSRTSLANGLENTVYYFKREID